MVETRDTQGVKRRVGLYLRISKDWKGDEAGVDRQREDGTRLIDMRGWDLVRVYIDNDISASGRRKRPDYQALLADIENGVIDGVVARSFERLCKSRREQLTFVELGQEKRSVVAFTHAPDLDLTTAVGRGMADMMAAWARVEMEQKSERHIDQIRQAAERGRMVGGRRAFGYTADGLHLDPVEAPILAQLYDRFLARESLGSLTRWLNARNLSTPQGSRWRSQTVREVLANPRNAAIRGMRPVVNQKTGTRAQWHVEIGPAVWPAAVPEQTWRATMKLIHDPHRPGNHEGGNRQKYVLTGIALCGVEDCGRLLITGGAKGDTSRVTGGRVHYRVLRCPSLRHISRRASYIEDWVELQIVGYFTGPGRHVVPVDVPDLDMEAVRSESTRLRAVLRGLAGDLVSGVLDRDQVRHGTGLARGRLAELDALIAAAGAVDVTAKLRAAADPEAVWFAMTVPEKRAVIREVATVRVLSGAAGRPGGRRFDPASVAVTFRR